MDAKLKPCPFCGSENIHMNHGLMDKHWVSCLDCGVFGPTHNTEKAAEAAWNRRAVILEPLLPPAPQESAQFDRYSKWLRDAVTVFDVDGAMDAAESDAADGKLTTEELDRLASIAEDVTDDLEGRGWV